MTANAAARLPPQHARVLARSQELQFSMNSDVLTGSLLRCLAASKPGGQFLELGTGCGLGTCWLLAGMTVDARLTTVDIDARFQGIAREELGADPRVTFHLGDGGAFLQSCETTFDLIYADAWPGKYSDLGAALRLLGPGGIYIVDDMLPQPNWPEDHPAKAAALRAQLQALDAFVVTTLDWSTGLILCVRRG